MKNTRFGIMSRKWSAHGCAHVLLSMAALALGGAAFAEGPITSGGGKAVVCFGENGSIKSVELLDLFEGRVAFGDVHLGQQQETEKRLVDTAIGRLKKTGYNLLGTEFGQITEAVDAVYKTYSFVGSEGELPITDDSYELVRVTRGCEIRQLAYYLDQSRILINAELYQRLSPLNRAALALHEAVYAVDRITTGKQDARHARRVVSTALAVNSDVGSAYEGLPGNYTICQSDGESYGDTIYRSRKLTYFVYYPNPDHPAWTKFRLLSFAGDIQTTKVEDDGMLWDSNIFNDDSNNARVANMLFTGKDAKILMVLERINTRPTDPSWNTTSLFVSGQKQTYPQFEASQPSNQLRCRLFNLQ
jgi:hypothetical protein